MEEVFGCIDEPLDATQKRVRLAARALARHNLVHAYGHVSARLNNESFLVCAPKPMGLIAPGEDGTIVANIRGIAARGFRGGKVSSKNL